METKQGPSWINSSIKIILFTMVLIMSLSLYAQQSTTNQKVITVKGSIENYDIIKSQFAKDSYIQLFVLPADGGYRVKTDSIGRMILISDYTKANVNSNGDFVFEFNYSKPEAYYVVAQLLKGRAYNAPVPFLLQNGGYVKFEIKEDVQFPYFLDLGKCYIKEK